MDDEIQIPVQIPLDSDGFLRRQCPACEREFKWFNHAEGDTDTQAVDQYFCPLCGEAAGVDQWWTDDQVEFAQAAAGPQIDRMVQESIADAFKGVKGIEFKPNRNFSLGLDDAVEPLHEPDDMVIVEPPCHANEPLKVPEDATSRLYCLLCGSAFSA